MRNPAKLISMFGRLKRPLNSHLFSKILKKIEKIHDKY